jgi:predicted ferric reductase
MGYAIVPIIASIVLVLHHIILTHASRWSKLVLAIVVAASILIWWYSAQWILFAILMQSRRRYRDAVWRPIGGAERCVAPS